MTLMAQGIPDVSQEQQENLVVERLLDTVLKLIKRRANHALETPRKTPAQGTQLDKSKYLPCSCYMKYTRTLASPEHKGWGKCNKWDGHSMGRS